jgi:hypothetical protein
MSKKETISWYENPSWWQVIVLAITFLAGIFLAGPVYYNDKVENVETQLNYCSYQLYHAGQINRYSVSGEGQTVIGTRNEIDCLGDSLTCIDAQYNGFG